MAKPAIVQTINPPSAKPVEPPHNLHLVTSDGVARCDGIHHHGARKEADPQADEDDLWDNVPI